MRNTVFIVLMCCSHHALFSQTISSIKNDRVKKVPEGTLKMVQMLKTIADTSTPASVFYLNSMRAGQLRKELVNAPAEVRFNKQGVLANELLLAGKTKEAIAELEAFLKTADSVKLNVPDKFYTLLGIAYMRLGEQQNCCANHTSQSCIVPIEGTGIHKLKEGSLKAIAVYKKLLANNPTDMQSRWLMNLAYMTIDEYPDSVPPQFLLPLKDSDPNSDFPRWKDVAPDARVDHDGLSGGSIMEDFDHDGYLDIMCSSYGLWEQLKYFRNNGDGTFKDITNDALLTGLTSGLNIIHMDYNNDGWEDVFVLRGGWLLRGGCHPNSLLKNNGDGTFEDVTIAAGLFSLHPTQTAAWADFNLDGYLDVFIGNESGKDDPHPCEFYMNKRDGTFVNVAAQLKMDITAYVKGVAFGDINNDGFADLYISTQGTNNVLFLNKGGTSISDWKFEEISRSAGVGEPAFSFPCWFFDYDNDGWEDIFVSGYSVRRDNVGFDAGIEYAGEKRIAETPRIFRNNRNNTFTDATKELGFENRVCYTMGSNFGDLDNDGWTDFYLGTGTPDYKAIVPNRMFHNDGGKFFSEVTYAGGFGHIQKGHGVAWGDVDNDGDQDIYIVIGGAVEGDVFPNALFENPGNTNNWITLQLEGTTCNKKAIGARIKVNVTDADNKQRDIYVITGTGGSFGSSSLQNEIGLGKATKINSLEIIFPDKKQETVIYKNVEMNKFYKVVQGKNRMEEVVKKKFAF